MKRKKWTIILCLALAIFIAFPTLLVILKRMEEPITLERPDTDNSINIGDSDTEKPADSNSPDDTDNSGDIIEPEIYGVYGSEGIDTDCCTYLRSIPVDYYDLKEHYSLQFSAFTDGRSDGGLVCVKVNPDYVSGFYSYWGDEYLYYFDDGQGVYILFAHSSEDCPDVTLEFKNIDEATAQSIEYIADVYVFEPALSGQWELPATLEQSLPYEYNINFTVYKGTLPGSEINEFDSFDVTSDGDCYFGDLKVGAEGEYLDTYFIDFGEEPQACDIYLYVWFWIYACNLNLV